MDQKLGALPLLGVFGEGAGSPSNTKLPGLRHTSVPSGILVHPAVWPQEIGRKLGREGSPFGEAGAGCPSNTMSPGPRLTSIQSGILIQPAIWPQQMWAENWEWGVVPLWGGGPGSPSLHNVARAQTYLHAKWHLYPFTSLANRHWRKTGGSAPFWGGGWVPT